MRIDRIEICDVAMPLLYPWRTASHEIWATEGVLVKLVHVLLDGKRHKVEDGADFGVMDSLHDLVAAVGGAVDARVSAGQAEPSPGIVPEPNSNLLEEMTVQRAVVEPA